MKRENGYRHGLLVVTLVQRGGPPSASKNGLRIPAAYKQNHMTYEDEK